MLRTFEVPLSEKGIGELLLRLNKIQEIINSSDFMEYLRKKVETTLYAVTNESLNSTNQALETGEYIKNHKVEVKDNVISLSNVTIIKQNEISENIRERYPFGFDLSKAVEYGTGFEGAGGYGSDIAAEDGWQYDVNNHGEKGWVYKDNTGYHWTAGVTGALVFYKTVNRVKDNINDWVAEYIDKEVGI